MRGTIAGLAAAAAACGPELVVDELDRGRFASAVYAIRAIDPDTAEARPLTLEAVSTAVSWVSPSMGPGSEAEVALFTEELAALALPSALAIAPSLDAGGVLAPAELRRVDLEGGRWSMVSAEAATVFRPLAVEVSAPAACLEAGGCWRDVPPRGWADCLVPCPIAEVSLPSVAEAATPREPDTCPSGFTRQDASCEPNPACGADSADCLGLGVDCERPLDPAAYPGHVPVDVGTPGQTPVPSPLWLALAAPGPGRALIAGGFEIPLVGPGNGKTLVVDRPVAVVGLCAAVTPARIVGCFEIVAGGSLRLERVAVSFEREAPIVVRSGGRLELVRARLEASPGARALVVERGGVVDAEASELGHDPRHPRAVSVEGELRLSEGAVAGGVRVGGRLELEGVAVRLTGTSSVSIEGGRLVARAARVESEASAAAMAVDRGTLSLDGSSVRHGARGCSPGPAAVAAASGARLDVSGSLLTGARGVFARSATVTAVDLRVRASCVGIEVEGGALWAERLEVSTAEEDHVIAVRGTSATVRLDDAILLGPGGRFEGVTLEQSEGTIRRLVARGVGSSALSVGPGTLVAEDVSVDGAGEDADGLASGAWVARGGRLSLTRAVIRDLAYGGVRVADGHVTLRDVALLGDPARCSNRPETRLCAGLRVELPLGEAPVSAPGVALERVRLEGWRSGVALRSPLGSWEGRAVSVGGAAECALRLDLPALPREVPRELSLADTNSAKLCLTAP